MKFIRKALFLLSLAPLFSGLGDNANAQDRWERRNADRDTQAQQEQKQDRERTDAVRKAWLGVEVATVDKVFATEHELKVTAGVYISDVVDDSPADDAGLRAGDVILKYNGNDLRSADELIDLVALGKPNDEVTLSISRDGATVTEVVTLGEWRDVRDRRFRSLRLDPQGDNFFFKEMSTTFIGVSLETISGQLADYFGVSGESAALVTEVEEESPAAKAGVQAGDVIVAVDGNDIQSLGDVQDAVREKDSGATVTLSVLRDKRQRDIPVEVAQRDTEQEWFGRVFRFDNDDDDVDVFHRRLPDIRGFHRGDMDSGMRFFDFQERGDHIRRLERKLERLERKLEEMQKQLEGR
ncbi:MAG TPA: PDZ domain-containing protein [candidate division Zixibacteria bacterium]|nr:PDZ domain-containing protein [candidate division Zixibacteria bacterium]